MKLLLDPGPIALETVNGKRIRESVSDDSGQPVYDMVEGQQRMRTKPAVATFKEFCLGLIVSPLFIGDKKGIDAAELMLSAKKSISAWGEQNTKALDDEHVRGLQRVVREHPFEQNISHNFVPYMREILEAKDSC